MEGERKCALTEELDGKHCMAACGVYISVRMFIFMRRSKIITRIVYFMINASNLVHR